MEIQTKAKFERDFNNCFVVKNKTVPIIKINKNRGIKTNYSSIKGFLISLVDYIMSHAT